MSDRDDIIDATAAAGWQAELADHDRQVRREVAEDIAQAIEGLEGADRIGTARWPERDRDIYSLATEEAAGVAREVGGTDE